MIRNTLHSFRMIFDRNQTERQKVVIFCKIQLVEHRVQCTGDTVLIEVTTVEQDVFLTISGIFFLAAAVFVKEYLSADFFGTVPIFIRGIFLHKCFIRGAAVSMCIWNDFGSIFCIMERISLNVFIHATGAFVFCTVVGKEDDFFAGVCIIIKNTGIIRDQYITEI